MPDLYTQSKEKWTKKNYNSWGGGGGGLPESFSFFLLLFFLIGLLCFEGVVQLI